MRIHPRTHQRQANFSPESALGSGSTPTQKNLSSLNLTAGPSFTGTPLGALDALEQWRTHEELTLRQSVRWPLEKSPLKVFIEPFPSQENSANENLNQKLFLAFRQWEAATQGLIRFQHCDAALLQAQNEDIRVVWKDSTTLGRDFEVGHTNRTLRGKHIQHVVITLIQSPIIDSYLSPEKQQQRLYTTILHEAGHALGLEHSDNPRDVMHHRGWQRPLLSQGDIQRIRDLYKQSQSLCF